MRSSLHFSIATVIAFFTCVPALAQEFHPYPEWGHEVWAGPDMVFNKRVQGEKGKLIHEYRLIDGNTAQVVKERVNGPFSPTEALPRYRQVVNWNGKTYRLGHFTRKEGKEKFVDILLTGLSEEDLSNISPEQPIASIPGEWYGMGHTYVDHRLSADGSKLLVYVYGIFAANKERSWACVVLDSKGNRWSSIQAHPKEVKPAKDHIIDDQGVVYVLTDSELFRLEQDKIEQFKIEVPTEGGLWAGALQLNGSTPQIFGFIGEKYFKEPKLVFMEFDPAARSLTALKSSEFPYLYKFVPKEVIMKKTDDAYWLTVSDRKWNTAAFPSFSATKDMYICRVHLDGSLEWAMHMPKMMTTYHIDQPDVILHPKDDQLIVLFQDHPDALEARQKGEEPKYGINKQRSRDTEYEIIQMTVTPDQKTDYKWFEVDGARSRWGYVQQIDEDTFFSGNAFKDEKRGFFYWTF